jgi:HAD superfamily hydrolase (TIGR01450 family)
MRLDDIRGFVFDLDGTLIHRANGGGFDTVGGAPEVLAAIRASGRALAIFTNASHVTPATIAAELRAEGLDVADDEVLTPVCSALSELTREHAGRRVYAFGTASTRARLQEAGVDLLADDEARHAEVVFVAHPERADFAVLDGAARALVAGAPLLTGSFASAYAGSDGPIFSHGAMLTAALAKASGTSPTIVGKPSRAAVREAESRTGLSGAALAMVGDDVGMDIALGRIGGWHTILVRTGIAGETDLDELPLDRRPHTAIDGVSALLASLRPDR